MMLKYVLLGIFSMYSVCAQDHAAAVGVDDAQNALVVKTETDEMRLDAADIAALESQIINGLLWFSSSQMCLRSDRGVATIDLSNFFETSEGVRLFIDAIRESRYSGESIEMVKSILMASDFLTVSEHKFKAYVNSIAAQQPLLLYRLYKDDTMQLGCDNWRVVGAILRAVTPFQLRQRLGVVGNQNPAIGHTHSIEAVAVVDADTIVTGSKDRTAIVWHKGAAGEWHLQQRLGAIGNEDPQYGHTGWVKAITVLNPDTIVTGSLDHTAIVWHKEADGEWQLQARLGAVRNQNPAIGHTAQILAATAVDGDTIVTGSYDDTAIVWHRGAAGEWHLQQRLGAVNNQNAAVGHTNLVHAVTAVGADTIVTGSYDNTAIVWHKDVAGEWQLQQRLGPVRNQNPAAGHTDAIWAVTVVDPNTIVTGSWDRTAIVWHKNAGEWCIQARLGAVGNQNPAAGHTSLISAVAVVDGDTIVTGSGDRTAIVWHREADGEWQLQERLGVVNNQDPAYGHAVTITAVAVLAGDTIVTGSDDHTAIVWRRDIQGYFEPILQSTQAAGSMSHPW